jgi:hypothetical protein
MSRNSITDSTHYERKKERNKREKTGEIFNKIVN